MQQGQGIGAVIVTKTEVEPLIAKEVVDEELQEAMVAGADVTGADLDPGRFRRLLTSTTGTSPNTGNTADSYS